MCPAICFLFVRHHSLSSFGGASRGRGPLLAGPQLLIPSQKRRPKFKSTFVLFLVGCFKPARSPRPLRPTPPPLCRQGSAPCYHTFIIPYLEWCLGSRVRTPLRCLVGGKGPVGHPNHGHHRAHNILFDTFAPMPASHLLIAAPVCAPLVVLQMNTLF
jgi:hypothetical protein